jgi:hypothetical protein
MLSLILLELKRKLIENMAEGGFLTFEIVNEGLPETLTVMFIVELFG